MAKIIENKDFVSKGDVKQLGKYLFDAEDGSKVVELVVWLEKTKANEKHPDGKPWIILPKDNITNRRYFSEDLFNEVKVNGEATIEVKLAPPRVLGASGIKPEITKYLDDKEAKTYTELVEKAVEAFKIAKDEAKNKKPENMDKDELEAYIAALRAGTVYEFKQGPKSFLDMFSDEEYEQYNELLAISATNKANMPKAKRAPLTEEEKAARASKRKATEISKAEALLEALLASLS